MMLRDRQLEKKQRNNLTNYLWNIEHNVMYDIKNWCDLSIQKIEKCIEKWVENVLKIYKFIE